MAHYIDKDDLVAEIERLKDNAHNGVSYHQSRQNVGLNNELSTWEHLESAFATILKIIETLEVKEANNVWHEVDSINMPQPDKHKIYCVLSKNKYLLARVREHPHDELFQWKCTEFPFHCYDMCEGDKYMQIG